MFLHRLQLHSPREREGILRLPVPERQRASSVAETVEADGRDGLVALPPSKVLRRVLLRVASVACGVQLGSLSGLLVQPFLGHVSDRRASSLGHRRPFAIGGSISIALYVILIGYFYDIGRILCNSYGGETRYGVIAV